MQFDVFAIINIIGIVAFAFVGAMKAIRAQMDILGIVVVGIVTALGGGVTRDVLINKIPNALNSGADLAVAAFGVLSAGLIYKAEKKDVSNCYYIMIPDALGLAMFTATGAIVAYSAGVSGVGLIILATITGVGGGVVGDVLLGRAPVILRDDFYATCSIIGGACFHIMASIGADFAKASMVCIGVTLLVRILAIHGRWRLPKLI